MKFIGMKTIKLCSRCERWSIIGGIRYPYTYFLVYTLRTMPQGVNLHPTFNSVAIVSLAPSEYVYS